MMLTVTLKKMGTIWGVDIFRIFMSSDQPGRHKGQMTENTRRPGSGHPSMTVTLKTEDRGSGDRGFLPWRQMQQIQQMKIKEIQIQHILKRGKWLNKLGGSTQGIPQWPYPWKLNTKPLAHRWLHRHLSIAKYGIPQFWILETQIKKTRASHRRALSSQWLLSIVVIYLLRQQLIGLLP